MSFTDEKWCSTRIGGAIGADNWSVGIFTRFPDGVASPPQSDVATFSAAVLSAFNTNCWSATTNPLKALATLDTTLFRCHGIYYVNGVAVQSADATITAVPGTGTGTKPRYMSQVCTLLTGTSARWARGRLYLPAQGVGTDGATGQANAAATTSLSVQMKAWLDAVNATTTALETSLTHRVIVGSKRPGHGLSSPVTSVRVDSIFDTQRGRGKDEPAAHISTLPLA